MTCQVWRTCIILYPHTVATQWKYSDLFIVGTFLYIVGLCLRKWCSTQHAYDMNDNGAKLWFVSWWVVQRNATDSLRLIRQHDVDSLNAPLRHCELAHGWETDCVHKDWMYSSHLILYHSSTQDQQMDRHQPTGEPGENANWIRQQWTRLSNDKRWTRPGWLDTRQKLQLMFKHSLMCLGPSKTKQTGGKTFVLAVEMYFHTWREVDRRLGGTHSTGARLLYCLSSFQEVKRVKFSSVRTHSVFVKNSMMVFQISERCLMCHCTPTPVTHHLLDGGLLIRVRSRSITWVLCPFNIMCKTQVDPRN